MYLVGGGGGGTRAAGRTFLSPNRLVRPVSSSSFLRRCVPPAKAATGVATGNQASRSHGGLVEAR